MCPPLFVFISEGCFSWKDNQEDGTSWYSCLSPWTSSCLMLDGPFGNSQFVCLTWKTLPGKTLFNFATVVDLISELAVVTRKSTSYYNVGNITASRGLERFWLIVKLPGHNFNILVQFYSYSQFEHSGAPKRHISSLKSRWRPKTKNLYFPRWPKTQIKMKHN